MLQGPLDHPLCIESVRIRALCHVGRLGGLHHYQATECGY